MIIIEHRINTVTALQNVPLSHGIEIDIRYHHNDIILAHDAFMHHTTHPTQLTTLLQAWQHQGPIILNLKTTGVENDCAALMQAYGIKQWFFLDMIAPTFWWHTRQSSGRQFGPANIALRCSEYEPIESTIPLRPHAQWVWLDTFSGTVCPSMIQRLQSAGFLVCLVSPELQSYAPHHITLMQQNLHGILPDAVCTKYPARWLQAK